MSGSFTDAAAPTVAADTAAIAQAVDAAYAATMATQPLVGAFIAEHGAQVSPGHADVVGPSGQPSDNDLGGPDASDLQGVK